MDTGGSIANRIKGLREETGLNQKEFAETLGNFSPDHLAKMERGDIKEPKYPHLIAISSYCGVSIDYLLTGREFQHSGKAIHQNTTMQTLAAQEAINHLNKCAKSIKKLDSTVVLGIQYFENQIKKLDRDPDTENALMMVKTELMERLVSN